MTTHTDQEAGLKIISTGSGELDKKMGGGIPLSSLTLIEGMSGAGKSTLSQHLLWGALSEGARAIVYTTENTTRSLIRQMESLGMDIRDYFLMDLLRIYPIETNAFGGDSVRAFQALGDHIERLAEYDVIVLDSLSTFLVETPEDEVLQFFARCKSLCDIGKGRAVICTAHSHAFGERILTRVRSVCDAHLRVLVEPGAGELVKSMEIAKIRGADMATGSIINFSIEPGIGMRIIPFSTARA